MTDCPTTKPAHRSRYSPRNPAPDAVRCPVPGCHRRRNPGRGGRLRVTCSQCVVEVDRPKLPRRPTGVVVLTRTVRAAHVWPVESAGEDSRVWATVRDLPKGTRARVLPGKAVGKGNAVLELAECGGRFCCPADAMTTTTTDTPLTLEDDR